MLIPARLRRRLPFRHMRLVSVKLEQRVNPRRGLLRRYWMGVALTRRLGHGQQNAGFTQKLRRTRMVTSNNRNGVVTGLEQRATAALVP